MEKSSCVFKCDGQKISVKGKYFYGADGAGSRFRQILNTINSAIESSEWMGIRYK